MESNKKPEVTVYIANYNYGQFLEQSIKSVLEQIYQNFELFIIDDGSTDHSKEVIKKYEGRHNIYVVQQENRGLAATNNVALKIARGKYIMRLDADDYLDPHALEIMTSTLDKNPHLALVFPDYYVVDASGEVLNLVRRNNFRDEVTLKDQPAHGACTMIRTHILRAVGGYDESFVCQDGFDLWLKIARDYPIQNINLPLFYYRKHGDSLSANEERLLKTRAKIKERHLQKKGIHPPSVLTVIPVRGRQSDPRSNPLAKLGGKCLLDWTLDAALHAQQVKDILVTSPDVHISEHVANRYKNKVLVIQRDPGLARINTQVTDTIVDALDFYSTDHPAPEYVLVLYIESPFRNAMYIDKAINTMQIYDVDAVDGVRLDDNLFYVHRGDGLEPWEDENGLRLERKSLYRRAGGLHLIKREFLQRERKMIGGRIGHFLLDQKAAFTIRTEMDWQIAKTLAKQQ